MVCVVVCVECGVVCGVHVVLLGGVTTPHTIHISHTSHTYIHT